MRTYLVQPFTPLSFVDGRHKQAGELMVNAQADALGSLTILEGDKPPRDANKPIMPD